MKEKKHQQFEKKALASTTMKAPTLGQAPDDKTFVMHDGRKLRTLYELVDELETMSEETFKSFVNDIKNDFASWVEGVFHDKPLAEELKRLKNRIEMQRGLLKHLVREAKRLGEQK
jgi:hypothetical protein